MSFAKLNDSIFIADTALDIIFEYDYNSGKLMNEFPIPEGCSTSFMMGLYIQNDTLFFMDSDYIMHNVFDAKSDSFPAVAVKSSGSSLSYYTDCSKKEIDFNNAFVRYIGCDGERNSYFSVFIPNWNSKVISGEYYLNRYSSEGELTGNALLPVDRFEFTPERYLYLSENGEVYVMGCLNGSAQVDRVFICEAN